MASETQFVKERYFKPDRENLRSLIGKDEVLRFWIYILLIVCFVSSFLIVIGKESYEANIVARTSFFSIILVYFVALTGRDKSDNVKNENITPNKEGKKYLISLGYEVKTLYGSALKSFRAKENIKRPLLLDAEQFKRHMLVMATIGAGKSVFMKGMIEQHILNDGGGLCVDGKGTTEFAKEIYALFVALGREDDFIHLNFLDMDNTHTINPLLSGSAEALYEILTALLEGEENEWKAKQKEFMKNILKLLVWKRDNEDLKLDFSVLSRYLTLDALVESAIEYRDKVYLSTALDDFVTYVSTAISMQFEKFLKANPDEIRNRMKEAQTNGEQGAYDSTMSASAWIGVITSLKSDYGRVFNTQTPTISMWEAVQRNKFIFVTLPTMASDTTPKQLGKLILGLIKGVAAEKAKNADEPKIPFICWFDEIGSYIIEGFGRLMSKSRALGITIIPIFQSPSQIDAVGKVVGSESLERREIFDTTGTHILMKNINPEATELYAKMVEEQRFIDMEYSDRREGVKGQIGTEDRYKVEKEPAIKHEQVVGMNNGEMLVFNDGKMYRATATTESSLARYGKKISFELKKMEEPIPITEYIPKKQFIADTYKLYKKLQMDKKVA
ncbi:TPA: TraM recognition domain-containing protein [Campylobacter fetus subsp. venerealis]|nr:TraM recognition domain-containing protein [Campylobacter fetus subsp. venerealis]HDX6253968.1 TraM recognition domain-containing protein [Campylobacter fetus subsp. venerealis]HDX6258156.1 TraM recognition domain-containing protein [Campylobacter fetus subsp. venerealis]HDX6261815.1 TraM recognition domain-containing protein [Campylobacter fetus subsp. venerealis]HDX6263945.1 TraM recognition domain-containing protein [Campylobacter fetus subsp. venerealis]